MCIDIVFHFHCFKDNYGLSFFHGIAFLHPDVENNSGQWRFYTVFFSGSSTNWSLYNRGTVICFRSGGRTGYRFGNDSGFYGFVKLYFVRSTVYFNVYDILFRIVYCNIVEVSVDFIFILFHCFNLLELIIIFSVSDAKCKFWNSKVSKYASLC